MILSTMILPVIAIIATVVSIWVAYVIATNTQDEINNMKLKRTINRARTSVIIWGVFVVGILWFIYEILSDDPITRVAIAKMILSVACILVSMFVEIIIFTIRTLSAQIGTNPYNQANPPDRE